MIILEYPYTSPEMSAYLAESRTPVLDNAAARNAPGGEKFNLLPDAAFAAEVNAGRRLYTTSESALEWVAANVDNASLLHGVSVMKDKFLLRETLRPLYPEYFFREAHVDELAGIDADALTYPLVLKPVVGFFSIGVHIVHNAAEWKRAVADILERRAGWRDAYRESVVGNERFIIEEYISGDEYAVDAYYDSDGVPVIVDILRHDFASASDVSDRLYYTSPALIRERLAEFTDYLARAGELLKLRDFPLHLEMRLSPKGIIPIEFNPLRFAGLCCTEVALFAYGIRTYQHYLENKRPDWDAILKGKNGVYTMIILDKPRGTAEDAALDFDAVAGQFSNVLHQRRLKGEIPGVFGFFFTECPAGDRAELDRAIHLDLNAFLKRS